MPKSTYIHIPFCKSKCKYCSFVSFSQNSINDKKLGYIFSLLKEIETFYEGESLKTLYFGGGTPSLIETKWIKKIIEQFNFENNAEITFEMNPDDADLEYLKELKNIGINRLSMGSQSFDDNILKLIGRRHNSSETIHAVQLAKEAEFNNISLDLIYGLPTQTQENLKKDIETLLSLDIQHISTYGLKIEDGSYFGKNPPQNLPDDDTQADMYLFINEQLQHAGFYRYEVSNFAKPGFESKHNLNYWDNNEYYGFGIASHGYKDGIRYSNTCDFDKYLANPAQHETGHVLTEQEKLEEEIFLGFRKEEGVNIEKIKNHFNIDFEEKYKPIIDKYSPQYIKKTDLGYKLTLEGTLLSNNILAEFLQ